MLKIVSWNIDGLSGENTITRATHAARLIVQESPDVIFLQECIDENTSIFTKAFTAKNYRVCDTPSSGGYYTMAYVKSTLQLHSSQRIAYTHKASSLMARDILSIELRLGATKLLCLSSHLESCKESSATRIEQLHQLFQRMHAYDGYALLTGDLNIRDTEVKIVSARMPPAFTALDAWESSGKPSEAKATWVLPNKPSVAFRFDRLYYNRLDMRVSSFTLLGKEVIPSVGATPSDHFGLVVSFELPIPLVQPAVVSGGKRSREEEEEVVTKAKRREQQLEALAKRQLIALEGGVVDNGGAPRPAVRPQLQHEVIDLT